MKNMQVSHPLALVLALTLLTGIALAAPSGAIYTTIKDGTAVNQNIYGLGTDVYLSGGPQNQNAAGLDDGTYYFQITDPSGNTLLSTDPAACRQLVVTGGRVTGSAGTPAACKHALGTFNPANGTTPVQMAPFSQTPNNGNEYKAWVVAVADATISGTDPKVLNFKNNASKTDNFKVQNVGPPPAIQSCLPSSSLSVLVQGANVSAYVPLGSWGQPTTGVKHVAVAGAAFAPVTIPTAAAVNSCSSNSVTGQTVCVSNGTDAYIIPTPAATAVGTTVTDLATTTQGFSGGSCKTCGVAIDSTLGTSGTAVLEIGTAAPGVGALEFLDLSSLSTAATTVVPLGMDTSENISLDPTRHLVLSPNEFGSVYQIYNYGTTPGLFNHPVVPRGILDAAASDCTTGIALSTSEGSDQLYIADLTQATFTAGTPGSWTPPATAEAVQVFTAFSTLSAGTSGIAVAPGTHLAIVAGEFGGTDFGVIQLPATSGGAFPSTGCDAGSTYCPIGDWVRFTMPLDTLGGVWSNGLDPHTVTAYTLGTTAFGLATNNARTFLANIDLACMLSATSGRGATHIAATPAACVTFI